jgi:5-dehydro-2-deoxygluconokinase
LLVELVCADEPALLLARIYEFGVRPDWWQLPPQSEASWRLCAEVIAAHDPYCRGMLLECDAQSAALTAQLSAAARCPRVRGLSVGRSIVAPVARAWIDGRWSDGVAAAEVARRCAALAESWAAAGAPPSDRSAR